jgi:hypothetical protein
MTPQLGLRTLLLLALVGPELFGARAKATGPALLSMLAVGHA